MRVDQLDSLALMDHREPQERGESLVQQEQPEKQGMQEPMDQLEPQVVKALKER